MSVLIGTPLNDTLVGDDGTDNTLFGDASGDLLSSSRPGAPAPPSGHDVLIGGSDSTNLMSGDAGRNLVSSPFGITRAGNDELTGGTNSVNAMFGDAVGNAAGAAICGDDVLVGGATSQNTMYGDVGGNVVFARPPNSSAGAGDDTLTGGTDSNNVMFGDAGGFVAFGGDDVLFGGAHSSNTMSGDAGGGFGTAGDDTLVGGENCTNTMFGDSMGDAQFGNLGALIPGDDQLIGGAGSVNEIFGDAGGTLFGEGGNDTLTGGADSSNVLVGDATAIAGGAGGNDILIAGDNAINTLVGDADTLGDPGFPEFPEFPAIGGDDRLVSGTGADDMWGDAKRVLAGSVGGHDIFRFLADSGDDTIHDFERGKDLIEVNASLLTPADVGTGARLAALAALAQSDLGKLTIEERDANSDGAMDSIIHLDAENSVTVLGVTGLTAEDFVAIPGTSYVLFTRTSTGGGHRDDWVGSEANSQPSTTPGSNVPASSFDADTATGPGAALAGAAAADYLTDGILQTLNLAMFNLTEASPGIFATGAPADLDAKIAAGTPFFGSAKTDLDPTQSDIDLAAGKLHLAQTDVDWNGIKNLEISLDSTTSFRSIRLENFVDTGLKIGDAAPSPAPDGASFDVQMLGTKRGEVDASLAPSAIALTLDVWTNSRGSQNSFDFKGSVFDDVVNIGAGSVFGSTFGTPPSLSDYFQGIYLGTFTKTFTNLGAGEDIFNSSNAIGDSLPLPLFQTADTVWGGSDDDFIETGAGTDRLFGDNGSAADFNADPANPVPLIDDDFITEPIVGSSVPDFDNGLGPMNLGKVVDMGLYTLSATGGDLVQLRSGSPGTFAGGLGIRSADDPIDSLDDVQIDGRGVVEEITIDFKDGVDSVQLGFTGLFFEDVVDASGRPGQLPEFVVVNVFLTDGSSFFTQDVAGGGTTEPGAESVDIAGGGILIDKIVLQPKQFPSDEFDNSDFFLSKIEARVGTQGASGDDVLDAGDGADFLQGDGDRGAAVYGTGNFIDIGASGGDQLFLGLVGFRAGPGPEDNFSDTVNYKFGDGFDVVRQFGHADPNQTVPAVNDKVTFGTGGHPATVREVNTSEGLSTWISSVDDPLHVEDPSHGVLVVGVTGLVIGTDIIFT